MSQRLSLPFEIQRHIPLFVCGATASGKSALALQLACQFDGEIVNADAFQLYRGIEVLSAAPSMREQELCPHHLFGVLPIDASNDAFSFMEKAQVVIADILARGKWPIVTGGSGMYLKFLTHGPSPLPAADSTLRCELDTLPLAELWHRLITLDPDSATSVPAENRRYVTRALEICLLTGQPASILRGAWHAEQRQRDFHLQGLLLQWPRTVLHQRIAQRCATMLATGAIDEVQAMPASASTAAQAIGVSQIRALLAGEIDFLSCEQQLIHATRQYAKRQETWFRRESWLHPLSCPPAHD